MPFNITTIILIALSDIIVPIPSFVQFNLIIIIIIIIYLTANGLSPGGSGYDACT